MPSSAPRTSSAVPPPKSAEVAPHPAPFSTSILSEIQQLLPRAIDLGYLPRHTLLGQLRVLDPFGGVGTLQSVLPGAFVNELEPEWVAQSPVHGRLMVGDATQLPVADGAIDVVITSPCYGNRMADHHDAKERCRWCRGSGRAPNLGYCPKCGGAGVRQYRRITYKHYLGRKLHNANAGAMQWGPRYKQLHIDAWIEAARVLRRRGLFVLNISDHWRQGEWAPVSEWHHDELSHLGFERVEALCTDVETPRMRFGANSHLRAPVEHLWVYRRP